MDPYNDNDGQQESLRINWEQLPKLPWFSHMLSPVMPPFLKYNEKWYQKTVSTRLALCAQMANRRLTQTETDALTFWWAKACSRQAWETPILAGFVYAFERRGRATYRFPFFTPDPATSAKRFPMLQGPMRTIAAHSARVFAYAWVGHFFVSNFLFSFSTSSALASIRTDERLRDYARNVAEFGKERLRRERQAASGGGGPRSPDPAVLYGKVSESDDDNERATERTGDAAQRALWTRITGGDNSNPAVESQDSSRQSAYPPIPQGNDKPIQTRRSSAPWSSNPSPSSPQSSSEDDPFTYDDASPVAPTERAKPISSSGSAWDRIRQQTRPADSQNQSSQSSGDAWSSPRREAASNRENGGGFSYNESDEESTYAKQQAQREFDEMLERERQGESEARSRRR